MIYRSIIIDFMELDPLSTHIKAYILINTVTNTSNRCTSFSVFLILSLSQAPLSINQWQMATYPA